jgi:hypothetical protein
LVTLTPLSLSAVSAIRAIPAFNQSNSANLNLDLALDFMVRRFVRPLADNVGVRGPASGDVSLPTVPPGMDGYHSRFS